MLATAIWVMAMLGSLFADRSVAQWVATHHPIDKHSLAIVILKLPGVYWTTLGIAALLGVFHRQHLRAAVLPLISGAIGGLAYLFLKWIVGRQRPVIAIAPFNFHPFIGGLQGLFRQPALSFPSGHATLSFATAMSLTILLPRWRWVWFVVALAVAAERVLENAHYVSDSIAGIGVGTLSALLVQHLLDRYWPSEAIESRHGFPVGK
jgi:membrane-associated phospholipid phosphatase